MRRRHRPPRLPVAQRGLHADPRVGVLNRLQQVHRRAGAAAQRRHRDLADVAIAAVPAHGAHALAEVGVALVADAGLVAAGLAVLLFRHPEPGQGLCQQRQMTAVQQLGVQRQVADPVDDLAGQRHQLVADLQQVAAPAQHAAGLADEIDGVVGQERQQFRPVQQHVAGEREGGGVDVLQRRAVAVDALPPRGRQQHVRRRLHRRDQRGHAIRRQHVVVVQELHVLALGQGDGARGAAEFAVALRIAVVADRERGSGGAAIHHLGDRLSGVVVTDDQF